CYIATLFNANPLLELDGYYILVDWLRLPDLRRRALEFVRGSLRKKVKVKRQMVKGQSGTTFLPFNFDLLPFSKEERIFTVYGLLALLYSLVAITFAAIFWRQKLVGTISGLLKNGGAIG